MKHILTGLFIIASCCCNTEIIAHCSKEKNTTPLIKPCTKKDTQHKKRDDNREQICSEKKECIPLSSSIEASSTSIEPIKKKQQTSRTITIKNAITSEMTKYRYWGSYFSPTTFYLSINGTQLKQDDHLEYSLGNNNNIEITYHYEFKNGLVSGSKSIEFEIPKEESSIAITFSWKSDNRLICDKGRVIGIKNSSMKSSCSFI